MPATGDFAPVPVVGRGQDQRASTLHREIDEWTTSPPLAALVEEFGGAVPDTDTVSRLDYLDAFSEEWDYRGKAAREGRAAERNQAVIVEFDAEREHLVMAAVDALGLVTPNYPKHSEYQHVLVNGALVRYSIWRMAYTRHLLTHGVRTGTVAALAAYRALARNESNPEVDEPTLLSRYGLPPVANEAEMMEFLLRSEFDLPKLQEVVAASGDTGMSRFEVRETSRDDVTYALVAAPDPSTAARARTGDTMRFWASEVVELKPGDRVLSISSAIYGPFQHAAALQHLSVPFGAEVDTVAIDFDVIPPQPPRYDFSPSQYLQEVRSTLRAYRELATTILADRS